VEGSDLLLTSTGQALASNTAVDTELTTVSGKLAKRTDRETQELVGWLRGFVAPAYSGNVRIVVQFASGGLQTPAA
jgi:hypothetical protein